ncbi:hypothetical protein [Microbacterium sp. ZKA21]|uniref:hypothetical protein n=1 Tax=Microbacterium sp. ZKA21 TaxID=3381694 RepID=UPI003D20E28E
MTEAQRVEIRNLFAALDISTAREQFELVHVLVGARIQSVADLDATKAAALVPRLRKRVESQSRQSTGSSWDDREEDTWIDNL